MNYEFCHLQAHCTLGHFLPTISFYNPFYEWNNRRGNDSRKKMWQSQMFHLQNVSKKEISFLYVDFIVAFSAI